MLTKKRRSKSRSKSRIKSIGRKTMVRKSMKKIRNSFNGSNSSGYVYKYDFINEIGNKVTIKIKSYEDEGFNTKKGKEINF